MTKDSHTSPDFVSTLGPLGLTLRLKRLADRLSEDGRRLYQDLDLGLEPSWYAFLLLLQRYRVLTVTQAAAHLRMSHPSVVATSRKLEQAGLLVTEVDPRDGRRRMLRLSEDASARMPAFQTLWEGFRRALALLIADSGTDVLTSLDAIEARLDARGLDTRVKQQFDSANAPATKSRNSSQDALNIRPVKAGDRRAVVHIAKELVRTADTYAFAPETGDDELWHYWCPKPPGRGYVAICDKQVVGVFVIRPNHPGPGAHVANASFAVRADMRGLGVGRRMGQASLEQARELGFRAMQFNIVVSTNRRAVDLWRSLGFRVVGTIPDGFQLPDGRLVPHYIMYRNLV